MEKRKILDNVNIINKKKYIKENTWKFYHEKWFEVYQSQVPKEPSRGVLNKRCSENVQ